MKTNKNLKITKKGIDPLRSDGESVKNTKIPKDKSAKRKLSIYDDFYDENPENIDYNFRNDQLDEE